MRKTKAIHFSRGKRRPGTQREALADAGIIAYLNTGSALGGTGNVGRATTHQSGSPDLLGAGGGGTPGQAQGAAGNPIDQQLSGLVQQLRTLQGAQLQQTEQLTKNTQALVQNTTAKSSGSSLAGTAANLASNLFGGLSTLSPILSGLFSLFGGGGSSPTTTPLTPFALPPSLIYQGGYAASQGGSIQPVDANQNGQVRAGASTYAPNIQVHINALDSQSFLDRSSDVANAVRQALLSSHPLAGVIADL